MRRDLRALIARAVVERDVDIVLLAESGVADGEMAAALTAANGQSYAAVSDAADKIRLFTRLPVAVWQKRQADAVNGRMAIWSVVVGRHPGILLAAAHFVPKGPSSNSGDQALLAVELAKEISRVEQGVGHERTLVVGDLNMNPFENGVTGANALHAVMTRKLAAKAQRTVQGNPYRFFYNPMWGHFGDRTDGPPGTYYHRPPSMTELFWHMYDQVLLRPSLMGLLDDLTILDRIDGESLLTPGFGVPYRQRYSDHLPLAFNLDLD